MGKILVNIPSRLDGELLPTINSLLENAINPELIDIYVYNQDLESNLWLQSQFPDNVLLVTIDHSKVFSVTHCRSTIESYVRPEHGYLLGIDSHMRFSPEWDLFLKDQLNNYPSDCVISMYPLPYTLGEGPETKLQERQGRIELCGEEMEQMFCPRYFDEKLEYRKSMMCGGYHFTYAKWLWEVKYDPYMGWRYEEIDMTIRSYTHGYDIVNLNFMPLYHNYLHENRKLKSFVQNNSGIDEYERIRSKVYRQNKTFREFEFSLGYKRTIEDFDREYQTDLKKKLKI